MNLWKRFPFAVLLSLGLAVSVPGADSLDKAAVGETIALPAAQTEGGLSLNKALSLRGSVREFSERVPTEAEAGQLLWAAQGINRPEKMRRTAPSAGATYPLEIYAILPGGVVHYIPKTHSVVKVLKGDMRETLAAAGLERGAVGDATCVFVICAVFERTQAKYGERGRQFVFLEGGHAAQNVLLQAVGLGMCGVPIGGFNDANIQKALRIPKEQAPIYVVATGFPNAKE